MSEPISPAGSQGPSPPAALVAAQAAAGQASTKANSTAMADAQAVAIQNAAQQSAEAAKLELSAAAQASTEKQPKAPVNMTMEEAAQAFQDYLNSLPSNLQFKPDYEAGIVVFKVVNPVTQKVIRQLPPEEVVNQVRALRIADKREHSGILLDQSL